MTHDLAPAAPPVDRGDSPTGPTRRGVVRLGAAAVVGVGGLAALAACGGDGTSSDGGSTGGGALAKVSDIPVGGAIVVTASAGPVVLARPADQEVAGFSARCPHQGCTVAPAQTDLACPCHGSTFETTTGKLIQGPATKDLSPFAVTIDGEDVVPA